MKILKYVFLFFGVIAFWACEQPKAAEAIEEFKPYEGPILVMNDVNLYFSDSAILKLNLRAPVQEEYVDGNRIFPKGMEMDFYDKKGRINSKLTAKYGTYDKKTNIYKAKGNVVISGVSEVKSMKTEELEWNPSTKRVHTNKFVKIRTQNEILTGNGLDAAQDFSTYKILNPTGVFSVNQ